MPMKMTVSPIPLAYLAIICGRLQIEVCFRLLPRFAVSIIDVELIEKFCKGQWYAAYSMIEELASSGPIPIPEVQ